MAASETSHTGDQSDHVALNSTSIPSLLKFVVSNLKHLIPTQLSTDNYSLWRSQIIKLFRANGFTHFLESASQAPPRLLHQDDGSTIPNSIYHQWILTDQNLAAALYSTISSSVLPYILHLESTSAILASLEARLQSTNRSRVIQLKNELHNILMKTSTMTQYLSEIKTFVDNIAAASSTVDTQDIIYSLPTSYQAFKTSICTMLHSISLDNLYSLLLSEEVNLAMDTSRGTTIPDPNLALYSSQLFPDPLWPTNARLLPAATCKLSSFKTVISGLVVYLKLTFLNAMSPLISSTTSERGSLASILVFLSRIEKTEPRACDPFTMSGVRANVSAIPSDVIISTMNDFMILPKLEAPFLISCAAYQRPTLIISSMPASSLPYRIFLAMEAENNAGS
ncbi:hypothetical protein M5K25_026232 [Dendrobium thyrsiflorum]|uniref:Retrotransposon Copia-like N-terminal domain-containing protein n=1 Tax=Dendrobium thyrsiflorum TaxID=117978 RepID=A0ABD0TWY1_DENTH